MDPQTKIKGKSALVVLGIVIIAFAVLVFGSYKIGMLRAMGALITFYGLVTFIGGIYAIARKKDNVMMKNGTIVITGILTIALGLVFII
ncbi:MAG: hypothetical protein WCP09_02640 [Candidatus Taylorbacteria bacterium]